MQRFPSMRPAAAAKACAAAALVLLLGSCYRSDAGRFDARVDARQDSAGDIAQPEPRDAAEDEADAADVPEEDAPTFTGLTFVIVNNDSDATGIPYYFTMEGGGDITNYFPMEQIAGGERTRVSWVPPWCTVSCEHHEDGCCIDCAYMPAVRALDPGEAITIPWDGAFYGMDYELCECGCYYPYRIDEGLFDITVCGYTSYECWVGPCRPDEGGMIWDALVSGEPDCITYGFEIPGDSGETITFHFPPGER